MRNYYTDRPNQQESSVCCSFLSWSFSEANSFSLMGRSFSAEFHVIKEAIIDVHQGGFGNLDICRDTRSALKALYTLVSRHRSITKSSDALKNEIAGQKAAELEYWPKFGNELFTFWSL